MNAFALHMSLLRHYFRGFLTFCFLYLTLRGFIRILNTFYDSCSPFFFVTLAVPAPTDLRFGLVGSDSMEVTWNSPRVPNRADINAFLVR